jgi:peptidoglycan/LPS O-acetylase OafA/YrhL
MTKKNRPKNIRKEAIRQGLVLPKIAPERRLLGLDLLRSVAVIMILLSHMGPCPKVYGVLHYVHAGFIRGGWVAVDLFFVLSGFLISGLLFNEHTRHGHISFGRFFIRRGFKIYPPLFFMMGVTYVIGVSKFRLGGSDLLPWFVFLQNYLQPARDYLWGFWGHTWSIANEEQFYLLLPWLLILLSRLSKDRPFALLPWIAAVIGLTCLGLRLWTDRHSPVYSYYTQRMPFHLRADSLFFGVFLSYLYHHHRERFTEIVGRFKVLFFFLGVIFLIPAFLFKEKVFFIHTFGYTVFYLGSGLLLCSMLVHDYGPARWLQPFVKIGVYSYSIYLWHYPLSNFYGADFYDNFGSLGMNWVYYAAIHLSGCIFVGVLTSKGLEYPMLKLRDSIYPSRAKV